MAAQISVPVEDLRTVAGNLNGGAAEIADKLNSLRGQVDGLGDAWRGASQEAFLGLYEQWNNSGRALHEALEGIARQVDNAANTFEEQDQATASGFRG